MLHFTIINIHFYIHLYRLCVSVLNSLPQVEVDAHTHTPLVAETSMDIMELSPVLPKLINARSSKAEIAPQHSFPRWEMMCCRTRVDSSGVADSPRCA